MASTNLVWHCLVWTCVLAGWEGLVALVLMFGSAQQVSLLEHVGTPNQMALQMFQLGACQAVV